MAYSLTCSHSRKIYHCSAGFFGSKNDKYISKLDNYITAVGRKSIYTNFEWTLDVTDTTTVQEKGVYLICDGGYHKWPHMICGLKVSVDDTVQVCVTDLSRLAAHFAKMAFTLVDST